MVNKWFGEKEIACALGIAITFSRLGSVASGWILPNLYEVHDNLFLPLFVATTSNVFSWLCGLILVLLDIKADKSENEEFL